MTRFASVVTRDISDEGVYLDCRAGDAIPLHRLVYLQLEREARDVAQLPAGVARRTRPVGRLSRRTLRAHHRNAVRLRAAPLVDPNARVCDERVQRSIA